jgi:hypothetical protein
MDMTRYVAMLNETIEVDLGAMKRRDGSICVRDCYGKTHNLGPELFMMLHPAIRNAISACLTWEDASGSD